MRFLYSSFSVHDYYLKVSDQGDAPLLSQLRVQLVSPPNRSRMEGPVRSYLSSQEEKSTGKPSFYVGFMALKVRGTSQPQPLNPTWLPRALKVVTVGVINRLWALLSVWVSLNQWHTVLSNLSVNMLLWLFICTNYTVIRYKLWQLAQQCAAGFPASVWIALSSGVTTFPPRLPFSKENMLQHQF